MIRTIRIRQTNVGTVTVGSSNLNNSIDDLSLFHTIDPIITTTLDNRI